MPGIPTLARCCRTALHSSSPSSHACCSGAGNPYMGPRQLCPCQHPPNHAQPALQAAQWEGARSNSIAMQMSRPMKFGPNGLTFPSPSRMQTLVSQHVLKIRKTWCLNKGTVVTTGTGDLFPAAPVSAEPGISQAPDHSPQPCAVSIQPTTSQHKTHSVNLPVISKGGWGCGGRSEEEEVRGVHGSWHDGGTEPFRTIM